MAFSNRFKGNSFGMVTESISAYRPGRVNWQASYWPAKLPDSNLSQRLSPGQMVNVIDRDGITLVVQPFAVS